MDKITERKYLGLLEESCGHMALRISKIKGKEDGEGIIRDWMGESRVILLK